MDYKSQPYHADLNIKPEETTEDALRREQMEVYKIELRIKSVENSLENTSIMDPQYDQLEEQLESLISKRRYHIERVAGIDFMLRRKQGLCNVVLTKQNECNNQNHSYEV